MLPSNSSSKRKSRVNKDQTDLELLSSQQLNIIDPVTKKTMIEAVRHTKCGHVYDKASILHMIKVDKKRGFKWVVRFFILRYFKFSD